MKHKLLTLLLTMALVLSSLTPIATQAATIKLSKTKLTIEVNATQKLKLSKINSTKVSWSSSDKKIATVSKWGTITAKAEGKTTVIAKYKNKKYKCIVTVVDTSDWVLFDTDNIKTLAKDLLSGDVIYKNGKYYCSPEYYENIVGAIIQAEKDYANENSLEDNELQPDTEYDFTEDNNEEDDDSLQNRIDEMMEEDYSTGNN